MDSGEDREEEEIAATQLEDQPLERPWPYLKEMFEFVGSKGNSWRMRCVLCKPKVHEVLAFKNSPSNLRKHIQVSVNVTLGSNIGLTLAAELGRLGEV